MKFFEMVAVQTAQYDSGYLYGNEPIGKLDRVGIAVWLKPAESIKHIKILATIPTEVFVDGLYHIETKELGGILLDKPGNPEWEQYLSPSNVIVKECNNWSIRTMDQDAYLRDVRARLTSYMRSSAFPNGSTSSEVDQPQLSVTPMYLNS